MNTSVIPVYELYGDLRRIPVPGFLHVERIATRAAIHGWSIGVHRHAALAQILLVGQGGAQATVDGRPMSLRPGDLLWLPVGSVHGFSFEPGTDGVVITLAADFLDDLVARDPTGDMMLRLATPLCGTAGAGPLDPLALAGIMAEEAGHPGAGSAAILSGLCQAVLAAASRLATEPAATPPAAPGLHLFRRFQALIDARFRDHPAIPDLAAALGTSDDTLYACCLRHAGRPPLAILHERTTLEAQRALIYTALTVSQIAFDLGFQDPAYFSRFFKQRTGQSPAAFRKLSLKPS